MYSFTQQPMTEIEIGNNAYEVSMSFDKVIGAFSVLDNPDLSADDKVNRVFEMLMDSSITRSTAIRTEIVGAIFNYLNERPYGHADEEYATDSGQANDLGYTADFDFEQDAAAIYASFLADYQLDLNKYLGVMHWDTFKALFDNLSPETPINRIRQVRNDNVAKHSDNPEKVAQLTEAQSYYRLDKWVDNDTQGAVMSSAFDGIFQTAER